ncbi:MAG TPA: potassium-transporting ATPase subunit F [Thermoanaerobaculia bacterium]
MNAETAIALALAAAALIYVLYALLRPERL